MNSRRAHHRYLVAVASSGRGTARPSVLGSFEVDDGWSFVRMRDGQLGGFSPLRNATIVIACCPTRRKVRSVGHQATADGNIAA